MSKELTLHNYEYCKKVLAKKKHALLSIKHNSSQYQKSIKFYFKLLLLVKAHAFSLDMESERRQLLHLLIKEMADLKML